MKRKKLMSSLDRGTPWKSEQKSMNCRVRSMNSTGTRELLRIISRDQRKRMIGMSSKRTLKDMIGELKKSE